MRTLFLCSYWMDWGAKSHKADNRCFYRQLTCPGNHARVRKGLPRTPSVGFPSRFFQGVPSTVSKIVMLFLVVVTIAQMALADPAFSRQVRLGYRSGDQWEPAMAADGHGHIYILYPQYGAVPDCGACTAPTMALLVSDNNGSSWQGSRRDASLPVRAI